LNTVKTGSPKLCLLSHLLHQNTDKQLFEEITSY